MTCLARRRRTKWCNFERSHPYMPVIVDGEGINARRADALSSSGEGF